jgi:hypothetical protein
VHIGFCWGNLKETDYLQDPALEGKSHETGLQNIRCESLDLIDLTQDKEKWPVVTYTVMNIQIPYNAGNFSTSCESIRF